MDFQRWMNDMRARTALALFLVSLLIGGMIVFALGSIAAPRVVRGSGAEVPVGGKKVEWRDFNSGLKQARAQHKRVVVDVYTDWCGWCKRMDRDTYSQDEIQKYLGKAFVPVRLNAESDERAVYKGNEYSYREIAAGFGVRGYPTTLFLESDGSHITTAGGYMGPDEFLTVLHYIGDGRYKDQTFEEFKAARASGGTAGSTAR
jgi:thioredoxin-related protein